ncbi:LLM class flavin-dependent oxidoreductase [Rhodococcus qingshengii]|uniref:LLM class flavin-dependent oxidoreductase n=1 Tax=Rhodococcus qingshengii TaxID=334542 RepID=UPI0010A65396|nr:LLM class flavin-dependent oxidoreductase [Rhodococcus qingshengii]THJ67688.1 LLM class flavin-dependent oxidoreductase [Rhodococcus qingshengii]
MTGKIKVGLLMALQAPASSELSSPEIFSSVPRLAEMLESHGFDSMFFTEHHGSDLNEVPSPFIASAAAAATTDKLRIGSAVALPAFYNPVRLAEDVTTLDNLSNGRVTVGVGMGYRQAEFDSFGVNAKFKVSHLIESVEILQRALRGEVFDFEGRVHSLRGVKVRPTAVQPTVPIWMGAQKRPGLTRAGNLGLSLPLSGAPIQIAAKQRKIYLEALAEGGFAHDSVEYPIVRECFCAPTDDEAWATAAPFLSMLFAEYSQFIKLPSVASDGSYRTDAGAIATDYDALREFGRDRMLIGSPETLIREFARHQEHLPCDHWILRMHFPGMPINTLAQSIDLFSAEVLPEITGSTGQKPFHLT